MSYMYGDRVVLESNVLGFWRVGIYSISWADRYCIAAAWDKNMLTALHKAQAKVEAQDQKRREKAERHDLLMEEYNTLKRRG